MAEKRIYDDSSEENGNSILVKRPKTGVDFVPPGTSLDYQHFSGDEDRPLDSGNYKDPLSGVTKDQRVVLYTFSMSCDRHGDIYLDDDLSMGDIDVMKTVEELVDRRLVERKQYDNTVYIYIPFHKRNQIMRSYRKNCLLSDIDKDFYIQVASDESLNVYAEMYFYHSRESEDTGPITLMRLIVEGRAQELRYYTIEDKLPPCEKNDREEFGMFVKDWCKVRDIDPMALSDGISDERTKTFYLAFTILSGLKDGLVVLHFPKRKWSILISILVSQSYSICVSELWEERSREIQQTFPALHDSNRGSTEDVLVFLQELIGSDNFLTSDTENNAVYFVSEDVRHQVMGYFVLNCLETTTDYENYINVSSVDSLMEYVRPSRYTRKINERCLHLPERMDKSFIMRLGVDAIRHVMVEERDNSEAHRNCSKIRKVVSEILQLPHDVFHQGPETVFKVCKFLKASINSTSYLQSAFSLNRFLGSFFIGEKTFRLRGILGGSFTPKKWSILVSILFSENYTVYLNASWKENHQQILNIFTVFNNSYDDTDGFCVEIVEELTSNDKFLKRCNHDDVIEFVSEDIRHCVMSYFVQNCLETDEDCKNYIKLSSVDSLLEYVRTWWYKKDVEERCMYLPEGMENVLIEKLGIDVLWHVMVESKMDSDGGKRYQEIRKALLEKWKLPPAVFNMSQETRKRFCNFVKGFVEVQQHHGLNLSSFLGSFLINLNASIEKDHLTLPLSSKKMSILCTVLVSNGYKLCLKRQWKDDIKKTRQTFSASESSDAVEDEILLKELVDNDKLLTLDNEANNVQFVSDDVRHKVMSYFAMNCLNTDEDYVNYINLASEVSLLEYVRTWGHEYVKEEKCIYLPRHLKDPYAKKLGINILCHIDVRDFYSREEELASKLNIPQEVLNWDYDARCRYVEYAKKGTQKTHRARAMIVGCAGAGKTTLLKRLQHYSIQELKQIKSTVGLEVHENLFQIDNSSLKGPPEEEDTENKCLLSVVDFAGQSAYYACHQVYLSRRAFYLLVIDLSKQFGQKVDRTLCEKEGTMFSDWTYGQYIIFWLKSIRTYCDDDSPVITIATHCEQIPNKGSEQVYDELLELLQDEPDLKKHLDRSRCFHVGFPQNDNEPLDTLSDLEECIVNIALEDRWEETIPIDWAFCEEIFRKNKHKGGKTISITDFNKQVSIKKKGKDKETSDVLRFYHDIGTILYFNEYGLKDNIIINVQWFVDCFKHIITDPMHVRDLAEYDRDWRHFYESGYLSSKFLKRIWKKYKMDIRKCTPTLKYMQRLGLIAAGKTEHYVPCVNKLDFSENLKQYISSLKQSTSVLVFHFRFLPHFFYFRLVVACMVDADWTVAEDAGQKQLFKNVVCFKFKDHLIVLAVNLTTIQAQVLRQGESQLSHEITKEIRFTIEKTLKKLTENFHKKTLYTIGYQCLKQNVLDENVLCFLREDEIYGKGKITCPRHEMRNYHTVSERELLGYWKYDKEYQFAEGKDDLEMRKQRRDNVQDCVDADQIRRVTSMTQGDRKYRQEVERIEPHACTHSETYNIHVDTVSIQGGTAVIGNKGNTSVNQDNSAI